MTSIIRRRAQRRVAEPRRVRGFTLVELLVVISIIALLIAILLPSLKKAREQTRIVKCLANMRSMQLGITYYADDHNQTLPGPLHPPIYRDTNLRDGESQFERFNPDTELPWFLLTRIGRYLAKTDEHLVLANEVSTCPTMLRSWPDENFLPNTIAPESKADQINPEHSHPYHYVVNSWGTTSPSFYFGWANIGTPWAGWEYQLENNDTAGDQLAVESGSARAPVKIDQIRRIAEEWSVGEAWWNEIVDRPIPTAPEQRTSRGTWQAGGGNSQYPLPRKPIHAGRKATDMAYFDGHASTWRGDVEDWLRFFPANRNPNHEYFLTTTSP